MAYMCCLHCLYVCSQLVRVCLTPGLFQRVISKEGEGEWGRVGPRRDQSTEGFISFGDKCIYSDLASDLCSISPSTTWPVSWCSHPTALGHGCSVRGFIRGAEWKEGWRTHKLRGALVLVYIYLYLWDVHVVIGQMTPVGDWPSLCSINRHPQPWFGHLGYSLTFVTVSRAYHLLSLPSLNHHADILIDCHYGNGFLGTLSTLLYSDIYAFW